VLLQLSNSFSVCPGSSTSESSTPDVPQLIIDLRGTVWCLRLSNTRAMEIRQALQLLQFLVNERRLKPREVPRPASAKRATRKQLAKAREILTAQLEQLELLSDDERQPLAERYLCFLEVERKHKQARLLNEWWDDERGFLAGHFECSIHQAMGDRRHGIGVPFDLKKIIIETELEGLDQDAIITQIRDLVPPTVQYPEIEFDELHNVVRQVRHK